MPSFNMLKVAIVVLVALLTSVDAESHMQKNCTPPNFKDPSDIKSKHKLCTTSRTGSNEQKLLNLLDEGGAGNVQDLVQGIGDRNGEKLINKYLGTLSGGTSPSQDELVAYLQAVGIYVAVPLLFLILNAMCCCTCTCARGVCWICPKCFRCCKCIPNDEHEYSRCSVIRPTIVWFLISIIMFTFAVVGIVLGTYKLVDSTSTSVCLVDDTYLSFQGFLDNVKEPLSLLDTNFKDAVDEMSDATEFPEELDNTVTYLGDSLADVEVWAKVANNSAHSPLPNQVCALLWEDIVTQSETAKSGTYASAEELNKVLADIQNSIKETIVDQSAPVSDAISDGVKSINEMSKSIGNILNPENNGLFQVADVSVTQRNNAAFSQWGYVFVVIILAIFGIFGMHKCKHEVNYEPDGRNPRSNPNLQGNAEKLNFIGGCFARMSSCSWCLALSFGILGALFAMLFLPLTVVVSDACPVLKEIPKQLGDIANQPIVQSISDTCWNETGNLFEGFGLNDVINTDSIDFGDLESAVAEPDVDDSGLVTLIELLDDMRTNHAACYNAANGNSSNIAKLNESIAFARLNVGWVKTNFSEDETAQNIADAGKKLVGAVDTSICQFRAASGCYFIKTTWGRVSALLCDQVNASLFYIGLFQLLIAVLAIPYTITLLIINRRLGGHGPIKGNAYGVDSKGIQAIELAEGGGSYYN